MPVQMFCVISLIFPYLPTNKFRHQQKSDYKSYLTLYYYYVKFIANLYYVKFDLVE